MSLSQKKPTISIPEYRPPAQPNFSAYGQTAKGLGNGGYGIVEDPSVLADYQAASKVRSDLINSLGLSGQANDPYAQAFQQESLRLSQPQLENSLIQRGLGGSTVYQGALTDLINKASTDAVLNSSQLRNNTLANLQSSYFGPYQALGQNLLQLASGANTNQEQLAQQMYQALLPYTAQVNYPKQSGLGGLISGGIQGFMSGGPIGAIAGAGTGYFGSQAPAYSVPLAFQGGINNYGNQGGLSLQKLLGIGGAF